MSTATQQPEAAVMDKVEDQPAADTPDTVATLTDRLERQQNSVAELIATHEAIKEPSAEEISKFNRTKQLWDGRVKSLSDQLEEAKKNPTAAAEKKVSTAKAKTGGLPTCPCGCGEANKPGSRFRPGHDARVKGMISRVDKDTAVEGFRFPSDLIKAANEHAEHLHVATYDAAFILEMNKKLQNGGGTKKKAVAEPKAEAEAEAPAAVEADAPEPVAAEA